MTLEIVGLCKIFHSDYPAFNNVCLEKLPPKIRKIKMASIAKLNSEKHQISWKNMITEMQKPEVVCLLQWCGSQLSVK